MPRVMRQISLGAALLGLAACANQPPPPPQICEAPAFHNAEAALGRGTAPAFPQSATAIDRRGVRMVDDANNLVHVEELRSGRRPNGSVEVAVRLLNCSAFPVQIEGAIQFLDAAGAQTEPPSVWKRVFLPPRSSRDFSEISTNARAAAFTIDIRRGS
ncbi:DUF1425 domain-containing protein [Falsiroseomonas sp.]|uniref:DUF1425 domain-containing protein n=1 Tax=Falsiroseomonas sp. TaxID=2870721 RepID=UPI003F6EF5BC